LKTEKEILAKLGITALNEMQVKAKKAINDNDNVILLSPTGTGKTVAFLLPLMERLNHDIQMVQALIIVPSRELAIQIEQVIREMGAGFKTNSVYGGQSFNQDKINLKHPPTIIVGTPGRVADHLRRGTFSVSHLKTLVLDEFDKSLEIGFEDEMKEICSELHHVEKRVLTSATNQTEIPRFIGFNEPVTVSNLKKGDAKMEMKSITSPTKDKLETLALSVGKLKNQPGIVFCNFKDSIQRVSDYLTEHSIAHGCFYGGLEQHERELALIKFRNGTHKLILATDLAARGLDIPELGFILHYHLPLKEHEFVHRNGRTARMHSDGTVYVLKYAEEVLPDFIPELEEAELHSEIVDEPVIWKTIMIGGGRRDKISKGDIAGLCFKQGGLQKDQLGLIELHPNNCFVSVAAEAALNLIQRIDGVKLKTKKVRVSGV
jgi:superfamily II DNA/RNA helicase